MKTHQDKTRLPLVVALAFVLTASYALPQREATTIRPSQAIVQDTFKLLQDQLLETNATSAMTFDTRTPPKIKQQQMQMTKLQQTKQKADVEKSHPGIAVPMDEETLLLDLQEDPKKLTFHKSGEKPTTDTGISTWILLSGQNGQTTTSKSKVTPKPVIVNKEEVFVEDVHNRKMNSSSAVVYDKPIKPIFKRRPAVTTTTKKTPTSTHPVSVSKEVVPAKITIDIKKVPATTTVAPTTNKLMKKASVVNSVPTGKNSTNKISTSTAKPKVTPDKKKPSAEPTEFVKVPIIKTSNTTVVKDINDTSIESNIISPEAKDGNLDLSTQSTNKKTRRPIHKKKKNKRRKTKPSAEDKVSTIVVSSNSTKLSTKVKEKPFGTQIYNYLSREVMPTVGVGLVGLMVTAGLASYFLYPFGALRRSYDIDRKDKEGSIYYKDPYHMGGVAEEEMIGKVIAGMPALSTKNQQQSQKLNNVDSAVNYNRIQGSRNSYNQQQQRYRQVEAKPLGTVESVDLPYANYRGNYQSSEISYVQNTPSVAQEEMQTYTEKQFVVGSIHKELEEAATPAVVPEHGPRRRKRRQVVVEDFENEVDSNIKKDGKEQFLSTTAQTAVEPNSSHGISTSFESEFDVENQHNPTTAVTDENMYAVADKIQSILDLVKDLIFYKLKMGLEILQNKTRSMSQYITRIQDRIEKTYREG